jgi:signal transduction histidine kinase
MSMTAAERDAQTDVLAKLQAKVKAQQKTIDILIEAAEQCASKGPTSAALLSHNLNLERIVQQKTKILQEQGEQLKKALLDVQLTQARLLQAKKLESVGQLAAGIAHEINTPAQFIASNIDFLDESFVGVRTLIEEMQKVLRAIVAGQGVEEIGRAAAKRLEELDWDYMCSEIPTAISQSREGINRVSSIVQAMKEFSHPGNKEKAHHDLNRIVETTIIVARNEWKYCAEVVTHLDPKLPQVFCLADEMSQVVLNMLINASHAIRDRVKGSRDKGLIIISTRTLDDVVEICIEDNGAGIPENIRDRVFDPFFTTKDVGMGTGQGLAICHDVVEKKHGGTIGFSSELGTGTSFILRLPIHPRDSSEPGSRQGLP